MQASHSMHFGGCKDCLHIAVEASLHFTRGLRRVKPEFHFDIQLLKPLCQIDMHHLLARRPGCNRCDSSTR